MRFARGALPRELKTVPNSPEYTRDVVLITNDGMGHAEPALRHKLLHLYLTLLAEQTVLPMAICFYTEGVKLVVEGSPVLELLRQIEARGVCLIICVTCLNYYGLEGKVRVGIVGGMHDIVEVQRRAQKVITI